MARTKYRRKASSRKRGTKRKRALYKAKRTSTRRKQRVPRRKLQTLFGLEKKYNDQTSAWTSVVNPASAVAIPIQNGTTYTGVSQFLGAAKQSATWDGRIAQKMTLSSIALQLIFDSQNHSAATFDDSFLAAKVFMYAVVLDKTPQAAYPSFADVFVVPKHISGGALLHDTVPFPERNPAYSKRFSVLAKGTVNIPPLPVVWNGIAFHQAQVLRVVRVPVKVAGKVLEFTQADTDGAVTTQTSNGISVFVWQNFGPNTKMFVRLNARTRFYG